MYLWQKRQIKEGFFNPGINVGIGADRKVIIIFCTLIGLFWSQMTAKKKQKRNAAEADQKV